MSCVSVVISNKNMYIYSSFLRADQCPRWQSVSQRKCQAVSHPPQRPLSLDKSQSNGSERKRRVGRNRGDGKALLSHSTEATQRARLVPAPGAALELFLARHIIRCMFYKCKGQAPALGNVVASTNKNCSKSRERKTVEKTSHIPKRGLK